MILNRLLATLLSSHYIPHGHCYLWQTPLVGIHAISDFVIAISYFSIPITLAYFVCKRKPTFSRHVFLLFGLFISLCGTGHIFDVITLWYPVYWLSGMVRACTAIVSAYTAIELIALLPQFLSFKSPDELQNINQQLTETIAKQVSAQEALGRSQQVLQGAFEDAPIGMALVSLEGKFLQVNKELIRIVGYTEAELLSTDFQTITHPDDLQIDLDHVHALISGNRRTYQLEKRYLHKRGNVVDIRLSVALLTGSENHPPYFIAHIEDITPQKQVNLSLELATKAAARSQAKSDFLSMMSHEIRTPMNAMIGMTELLGESSLDSQQQDYVEVIRTSGNTLLTVINDILDFSKIDSHKLKLEMCRLDLYNCIEGVLSLFSNQAEQKGLSLTVLVDSIDMPHVFRGDPIRLRQILANLVSNSIKFTKTGEVSIRAKIHPATIEKFAEKEPTEKLSKQYYDIQFSIKDTGIGIAQHKIQKLFKPFSQVDTSTTRKFGGTGLGLVISKQLIEMMNGEIWVESELGQGATFHFFIRLEADQQSGLISFNSQHETDLSQKRLLIVDSNQTSREHLSLQANSWRLNVCAVASAETALIKLMQADTFDVISLSEPLPDMDSYQFVRQLQHLPNYQAVPVILFKPQRQELSTHSESFTSHIKVLRKPVRRSQFYNALVQQLLGKHLTTRHKNVKKLSVQPTLSAENPLRILLVEDILLNQKVALQILKTLGYWADVVENGKAAIAAIQQHTYDLVLMDIQMPEMDGLEATKYIRSDPDVIQPRIVAMTAHALQEDRETCLAAGMDDYLSKPIRKRDIAMALQQCSALEANFKPSDQRSFGSQSSQITANMPAEVTDMLLKLADLSTLDTQSFESVSTDASFLAEVCDVFLTDAPSRISAIQAALEKEDALALSQTAHALKSLSSCVGANRLFQLCKAVETIGKMDCVQPALTLVDQVNTEYCQVRSALKHYQKTL
ncbi:response regulator [Leptolyngbya cf. ectocarpi LEGE 11479]|uniref:Circadian input-output histidine kinase CikA n=1 Tax=Leptolyngbya cf. ectocarpi LEGE 11479 TaxID=1828722 RepID=A0A929FD16_LEPEC|nr:response regulator [Leptolyngbya ectocarpi]MBE9070163.1 response regulator [Leptolyngbya cf. ectocarpi LEGE 11479]